MNKWDFIPQLLFIPQLGYYHELSSPSWFPGRREPPSHFFGQRHGTNTVRSMILWLVM